ncbi:MAG: methyltransferase domain-containing protein [Parasphingorhabdus sp.]|uniref:class I SAM-dependent methyltransferase n=1 Tax=Parasphingorhabdus sp. TaxID=2709688 RepID=UPI0030024815
MNDITESRKSARHAALMNRVYRSQKHIYDATRKYYLLGRDELIADLNPPQSAHILELGCGTARNLLKAAEIWPHAEFYGLDISSTMLNIARNKVAESQLNDRITLSEGDAEHPVIYSGADDKKFDRIFLSFCLSMIPDWQAVIQQSIGLLRNNGELHIVDFGQSAKLPNLFRRLLMGWLAKFHVAPRRDLPAYLEKLETELPIRVEFQSLYRDYSWRFKIRRIPDSTNNV